MPAIIIFGIFSKEGFVGIPSMYFSVSFLFIPSAIIANGIVFVLSFQTFLLLFQRLYIWKACQILPAGTVTSNMVPVRSLKSLIIVPGRFASIFLSV